MVQASTWQCKKDLRLETWSLRRWLVLLLILAFSTSGLAHAPVGDDVASAASLSHEIASVGLASTGEQPCAGDADEPHRATCCMASLCSFCVPLPSSSAAMTRTMVAEVVPALPDEIHHGLATSPGFRPPSLSTNV
jgi:hypothetical protein